LQKRQKPGDRGRAFYEYTKVCSHPGGQGPLICFRNKGAWAISGMTKHNLTPCQAQHAEINLIYFPALPDCSPACLRESSLIGKLAETCPAGSEAR